jgi:hypothetical protein
MVETMAWFHNLVSLGRNAVCLIRSDRDYICNRRGYKMEV